MNSLKVIMFVFSLFLVGSAFGEGKKFNDGERPSELTEGKCWLSLTGGSGGYFG